jgi:hypothetical protein
MLENLLLFCVISSGRIDMNFQVVTIQSPTQIVPTSNVLIRTSKLDKCIRDYAITYVADLPLVLHSILLECPQECSLRLLSYIGEAQTVTCVCSPLSAVRTVLCTSPKLHGHT